MFIFVSRFLNFNANFMCFVLLFPKQRKQRMFRGISSISVFKPNVILSKMQCVPLIRVGQMGNTQSRRPTQPSQMGSSLTLPLPFLVTIHHTQSDHISSISLFFRCGMDFKIALYSISFDLPSLNISLISLSKRALPFASFCFS